MSLDKTNPEVIKLATAANSLTRFGFDMSIDECVVQAIVEPSFHTNGHDFQEIVSCIRRRRGIAESDIRFSLAKLNELGIVKTWQPGGTMSGDRPTLYQPTLEFTSLMTQIGLNRHVNETLSALLEPNIKVKGTAVTFADILGFHKHVPWILEHYPSLKEVYCGPVKLTREEAAILLGEIEKHSIL